MSSSEVSSIQKWHSGKLVLLWGVAAFFFWIVMLANSVRLWAVWFAYVLFCLVVSWVWFGGREGKENDKR